MALTQGGSVTLPIGLDWEGTRYRELTIDQMSGVDEGNVSDRKVRNNGAKAITVMLQRCVQSVEGLADAKADMYELLPQGYFRRMYSPDRDFLFLAIRSLGIEPILPIAVRCPMCNTVNDIEVDIETLDVYEWPEGDEPEFTFTLPQGFKQKDGTFAREVTWRIPDGRAMESLAGEPKARQGTAAIAMCIKAVAGLQSRPDFEAVHRLSTRDRQFIATVTKEYTPGVDLRREVDCIECDHKWLAEVEPSAFFSKESAEAQRTTQTGTGGPKRRKRA